LFTGLLLSLKYPFGFCVMSYIFFFQ